MAFLFTLILFAVFFVLNEFLKPKTQEEQNRVGLEDFRFPTATEGRPVPLVWGTVRIQGPNVIWYGDLSQEAITKEVKTGIFSSDTVTTGYKYRVGIQFAICRGPDVELRRIWIGEELAFTGDLDVDDELATIDDSEFFGGNELGNGGIQGDIRWYTGTETQPVNSYLAPFQLQGGDTPAYVGTAYLMAQSFYVGNSTTIKPWAFEVRRLPNGLGLSAADNGLNGGNDLNPMSAIYEILTNDEWGLNFPAADIDTANFTAAALVLATEGNGFSFVLDRTIEMVELLREIERQIDGVVFLDRSTGKWVVKLARDDYDIDTVAQATDANVSSVMEFSRGAWEDTINHVKVGFQDRAKDYFDTFALAQDMANVEIQGGQNNTTVISYPGVKNTTLANVLAWRDIRVLSFPLARAKLEVDRAFWDTNPADVIAWTNAELGFVKLPMRVTRIDLGDLREGKIVLDLVQDVFTFSAASFGDAPPSGWIPPVDSLVPFPDDEQVAFEAPYAFIARDPVFPGQRSRVWCSGRNQGDGAALYDVTTRFAPVNPSGGFVDTGTVTGFMLVAELVNSVSKSLSAIPELTLDITAANFDPKTTIQAAIGDVSANDIGLGLAHIAMIGDPETDTVEFIGFETEGSVQADPAIRLSNVYRGLLDTTPQDWAAGTKVYLLFVGGGLNDSSFPEFDDVDVRLLPRSTTDQVAGGSAFVEDLFFDRRDKKAYPPSEMTLEGTFYDTTTNMDNGTTLDNRGVTVGYNRRDWRSPNEVEGLTVDASLIQTNFPAFNGTEYRLRVIDDPDGSPTTLYVTDWNTGQASIELERKKLLRETSGIQTGRLRVEIDTRHDISPSAPGEQDVLANYVLRHDFNVTFDLISAHFNMGALDSNVVGSGYTAPTTGTYTFNIGSDVLTGGAQVQAQINGGGFVSVITAGLTTGTLAGVTAGDTIEVRHTQSAGFTETFLEVNAPSSSSDAYAILIGD